MLSWPYANTKYAKHEKYGFHQKSIHFLWELLCQKSQPKPWGHSGWEHGAKKCISKLQHNLKEKNKEVENQNIKIENKDKEITDFKTKMRDMDNQIVKKDLAVNQVEIALRASKVKIWKV